VDEGLVTELESAIADSGALVVRAQKYRRGAGPEGAALLGAALALGDEARRLHRRDALDAAAAAHLLAGARALAERLQALLAEVLLMTKMNWNSARFAEKLPVTVRFADEVGTILRDLPDDYTPEARYAFYM